MPKKPIDLDRVRRADERLARLLQAHPELREANPERQAALEAWLTEQMQKENDDAQETHR
jgi:hypothetical protein